MIRRYPYFNILHQSVYFLEHYLVKILNILHLYFLLLLFNNKLIYFCSVNKQIAGTHGHICPCDDVHAKINI